MTNPLSFAKVKFAYQLNCGISLIPFEGQVCHTNKSCECPSKKEVTLVNHLLRTRGDNDNIHIVVVILKINKDDGIPDFRWF